MVSCTSDQVKTARKYLLDYLSGKGVSLDAKQIDALVTKCCQDYKSKECAEAIAAVVATEFCDYYTSNACEPCCVMAGNIVGPYAVKAVTVQVEILKDVWDFVTGLFKKKQCDYDPAYNKLRAAYVSTLEEIAAGIQASWDDTFKKLGIKKPPWAEPGKIPVKPWAGFGRKGWAHLRPCSYDDPNIGTPDKAPFYGAKQVRPIDLILYAAFVSVVGTDKGRNKIVDHGSQGVMVLYALSVDPLSSPQDAFRVTWKHWSCADNWQTNWKNSIETLLGMRWDLISGWGGERMNKWMLEAISDTIRKSGAQNTVRFKNMLRTMQGAGPTPPPTDVRPSVLTKDYVEARIDELNTDIFDALDAGQITEECIDLPGYDAFRDAWDDALDTHFQTGLPIPADILATYDVGVDHYRTQLNVCKGEKVGPVEVVEPGPPKVEVTPPGIPVTTGMMPASQARSILLQVWKDTTGRTASLAELQIAQAIGRFEGRWGSSRAKNNWGGVQCLSRPPCPDGCIEYTDTHADGTKYQGCLKVYPTQEAGAADMVRLITIKRPGVWEAMRAGDAGQVASKMRKTGYFEAPASKYQQAIYSNAKQIAAELNEPLRVKKGTIEARKEAGGRLVLLAMAIAGAIALKRKG